MKEHVHSYAPFSTVMKPDNDLNYFLVASAGIRDLVDVEHAQYRLNYLSINFQHHFFLFCFSERLTPVRNCG